MTNHPSPRPAGFSRPGLEVFVIPCGAKAAHPGHRWENLDLAGDECWCDGSDGDDGPYTGSARERRAYEEATGGA